MRMPPPKNKQLDDAEVLAVLVELDPRFAHAPVEWSVAIGRQLLSSDEVEPAQCKPPVPGPCPFCGHESIIAKLVAEDTHACYCAGCGTTGPVADDEQESIASWNAWLTVPGRLVLPPEAYSAAAQAMNDDGWPGISTADVRRMFSYLLRGAGYKPDNPLTVSRLDSALAQKVRALADTERYLGRYGARPAPLKFPRKEPTFLSEATRRHGIQGCLLRAPDVLRFLADCETQAERDAVYPTRYLLQLARDLETTLRFVQAMPLKEFPGEGEDWPASWKQSGCNHSLRHAPAALRYLSLRELPKEEHADWNPDVLQRLADDLELTHDYLKACVLES